MIIGNGEDTMELNEAMEFGLQQLGAGNLTKLGQTALERLQSATEAAGNIGDAIDSVTNTVRSAQNAAERVLSSAQLLSQAISVAKEVPDAIADMADRITTQEMIASAPYEAPAESRLAIASDPQTADGDTTRLPSGVSGSASEDTQAEAPAEVPAAPAPVKRGFSLFGVVTAAVLTVMVLIGLYGVIMALTNYRAAQGLSGSTFVGLDNLDRLFNYPGFLGILRNSLVLRALQLAGGLVLALPIILWVKLGKQPGRMLTKACLCLIPMCLPSVISTLTVMRALPRDILLDQNGTYLSFALSTCLQTAGFIAFCGGLFAYLNLRGIGNGAGQGVLIALLISALSLATPDSTSVLMLSNGMNRSTANTFDYYAYNAGIIQMQYSYSSAASLVKTALQMALAIAPSIILCKIAKRDETRLEIPDTEGSFLTFTGAKLAWLALLAALALATFGVETVMRLPEESLEAFSGAAMTLNERLPLMNLAIVTGMTAILGGVLAGFASFSFIAHFRAGRRGFGLAMVIAASSLSFLVAQFALVRYSGMVNTVWPMILRQIADPRLLSLAFALAIALRMAPERSTRGVVLGLMLLAAAFAWGDVFSPLLYAYSGNNTTFAAALYRLFMQGGVDISGEGVTQAQVLAQQAQIPLISLLVSVPALALGFGGAASLIRGFKAAQ